MANRAATLLAVAKRSLFASQELPIALGLEFEGAQVSPLLMRPETIAIEEEVLRRYAATPRAIPRHRAGQPGRCHAGFGRTWGYQGWRSGSPGESCSDSPGVNGTVGRVAGRVS